MLRNQIYFGSTNKFKIDEMLKFTKDFCNIFPISDWELDKNYKLKYIIEDGATYLENAKKKAMTYAQQINKIVISDDSGLEVDKLNGAPGIISGRWCGEEATDEERCQYLLEKMESYLDRRAEYKCTLVLAKPNGQYMYWEGSIKGLITRQLIGDKGFAYDPIFYIPTVNKTFAQLNDNERFYLSHRARAFKNLFNNIEDILHFLS